MDVKKYKLTGSQESIYSIETFYQNTPINNISGMLVINEKLDIKALLKALNNFIENNDSTRIQIGVDEKNSPFQYITQFKETNYDVLHFSNLEEVSKFTKDVTNTPLFNYDSKLFKLYLFTLPNGNGGFTLTIHHLISDAWSIQLSIDNILSNYSNILNNRKIINNTNYSYTEYINSYENYLNSNKYKKDKEFWNNNFPNDYTPITVPSLIYDTNKFIDYSAGRKSFTIPKNKLSKIVEYCNSNKITLYAFFLAVHSFYLSRINNTENFTIGTPVINRTNIQEKNTLGLFISTIPFSSTIDMNANFSEYANKLTSNTLKYFRHQKYPYQHILKNIKQETKEDINTSYNILFSYQKTKHNRDILDIDFSATWFQPEAIFNDIQIHIYDVSDTGLLSLSYDYKTSKYTENEIKELYYRISYIIDQILNSNKYIKLSDIEIVTPKEQNKLLYTFNKTTLDYDKTQTIHSLIEKQVIKNSDKIAIACNNKYLTYKELNSRANQIAHYLRKTGIKPNTFVGVLCDRSVEMIIALLGILKAGAAYLPIDPDYPLDRITYMLENSETKIVLSKQQFFNLISDKIQKIDITLSKENKLYKSPATNPKNINSSEDLAYIIYTSGLTGKPKGVKLNHRNINNFILGTTKKINFSQDKTIVSLTTVCFDIFVLESWLPLQNGLTIIIANEQEQNDIKLLNKLCLKYNVNIIQTTPSRLNKLTNDVEYCRYFNNLTDILIGGEQLSQVLLNRLRNLSTKAKIYNMYGPTETAVWSSIKKISKSQKITIGTPIANTRFYVLDEKNLKLLPVGTPGILYIGGDGICSGYHKHDNLNKKLFITNPYNIDEKIYNTNDLVKQLPNGELIHLGRTDFQVKIRGYRIELDEIKNKILEYPNIQEAIIHSYNSKFLICYYSSSCDIIISNLISYLLSYLPNYMIPAYFIKLDKLPLTANGKVDIHKLPIPNLDTNEILEIASTKTEKLIEENILKILNNGMKHIDINTPFISLGLDSLSIVQLQSMLLRHKLNLTTQTFYKYSTIKKLATHINKSETIKNETTFNLDSSLLHLNNEKAIPVENDLELGNVFLTGANGFIGIHILKELLDTTTQNIYCLVRGATLDFSIKRICKSYKYYFGVSLDEYLEKRVFIINGDITSNSLNLTDEDYLLLKENVNTVIHTAAIVKHYGNFAEFKQINIDGTNNIANFAYNNHFRLIHISSISISGNYLLKQDSRNIEFSENNLYIGQHYTENVYVNSKLEAENIVFSLMKKGLKGKVLRIGILSGRASDGFFQENISANAFYSRIKSLATLKMVSENMLSQNIEFTPVDDCAKAIVLLAKTTQYDNKIFHLYNHNLVQVKDIIEELNKFNMNIQILPDSKFENKIIEYSQLINNNVQAIVNDFDTNNLSLNYNFSVNIKSDYTQNILKDLGFKWNKITKSYLYKIFKHMRNVDFI